MSGDLVGIGKIVDDAASENLLHGSGRDFVLTLRAGVVGTAGIHIHLPATAALSRPAKMWTGFLPGLRLGLVCSSRTAATRSKVSAETMAGHSTEPHSLSGFASLFQPPAVVTR